MIYIFTIILQHHYHWRNWMLPVDAIGVDLRKILVENKFGRFNYVHCLLHWKRIRHWKSLVSYIFFLFVVRSCCVVCVLLFVVFSVLSLCVPFLRSSLFFSCSLFFFFLSSLLPLCILYQDVSCNGLTDGDFQYLTTSLMAAKASALKMIKYDNNNLTSSLGEKRIQEILKYGSVNEEQKVVRSLK